MTHGIICAPVKDINAATRDAEQILAEASQRVRNVAQQQGQLVRVASKLC